MDNSRVTLSIENHIATAALSRPEKYNGLNLEPLSELMKAAKAPKKNRDVRVVIPRGEGKAFCAGLDFGTVTKALFQSTWNADEAFAFGQKSRLRFKLLRGKNQREAMNANFKKRAPSLRPRQRDD